MHGIREELLDQQSQSTGIPLLKVRVREGTNDEYEKRMETVLLSIKSEGIRHVIFGDIFLEDLRAYREQNLTRAGMEAVFPLWKTDTRILIQDFIKQQFKAIVCCTNDAYLGKEWAGRQIDRSFVQELPCNVDSCGENGEYHTFCYEGPIFKKNIKFSIGDTVFQPLELSSHDIAQQNYPTTKGFWYCDLLRQV